MGRTLKDIADGQSTPTYVDDCLHPVTWSDAMLMTSLCGDVAMTSEPVMGVVEWNWRVIPLVALVAAGIVGNTLVCASVATERRLHNVTNYFLVSLAVADLFVSLVVMPCCIVQEFIGQSSLRLLLCTHNVIIQSKNMSRIMLFESQSAARSVFKMFAFHQHRSFKPNAPLVTLMLVVPALYAASPRVYPIRALKERSKVK